MRAQWQDRSEEGWPGYSSWPPSLSSGSSSHPCSLAARRSTRPRSATAWSRCSTKAILAIVRRSASYRVGDIVLYESPILHRPVLHRIIVIQNGHYFFKGDHNSFVDPGYATSSELLGKLWIHVPKAGRVLSWFGAPMHTALLGGAAAGFLFLGGNRKGKRRRRKRIGSERHVPRPKTAMKSVSRYIHRPRKSAENIVGSAAFLLAAVLIAAGFGATPARTVSVTGFHQTGTFSYTREGPPCDHGLYRRSRPLRAADLPELDQEHERRVLLSIRIEARPQRARHRDADGARRLRRKLAPPLHAREDDDLQGRCRPCRRYLRSETAAGADQRDLDRGRAPPARPTRSSSSRSSGSTARSAVSESALASCPSCRSRSARRCST